MSLERAVGRVLHHLSDGQVEALAAVCDTGPGAGAALSASVVGGTVASREAVKALATEWAASDGFTGPGIALALRVGLLARVDARARRALPVWTGPGATGEQRLTASVLHELVAGARERILLVSYAAYTLSDLAADLADAVARDCTVDVVFETEEDSSGGYHGPHSTPFGAVEGIRRWRWPADQRPAGAALHAKLLVVDGCRALLGSANLTHRALSANLEAGLLVRDPEVAGELESHVLGLMKAGALETS
ncbi:MAG TPA: DISARM system phospholipase D-like protein DrmC [Solirubrobacteraceae bacterium]|nr:DISARM system phospholipase D-like protein DrmC [Solirubrobacteraceae bacterium]